MSVILFTGDALLCHFLSWTEPPPPTPRQHLPLDNTSPHWTAPNPFEITPPPTTPPPGQHHTPPPSTSGWYVSHWNAFLFLVFSLLKVSLVFPTVVTDPQTHRQKKKFGGWFRSRSHSPEKEMQARDREASTTQDREVVTKSAPRVRSRPPLDYQPTSHSLPSFFR